MFFIPGSVSELYLKNSTPTPDEIDQTIRNLKIASITAVFLDANGKPVDKFGTPFRVRREGKGTPQTVTATSAGPDRRLDTPDDITNSTVAEVRLEKKP